MFGSIKYNQSTTLSLNIPAQYSVGLYMEYKGSQPCAMATEGHALVWSAYRLFSEQYLDFHTSACPTFVLLLQLSAMSLFQLLCDYTVKNSGTPLTIENAILRTMLSPAQVLFTCKLTQRLAHHICVTLSDRGDGDRALKQAFHSRASSCI